LTTASAAATTTRALKLVLGATVTSTRLVTGVYVHLGTICRLQTLLPSASVRRWLRLYAGIALAAGI